MSFLDSKFLLKAVQGSYLKKGNGFFSGVATDSRQKIRNKVFFALKGEHFDGHDFLTQAKNQGAKAFVVSDKRKAKTLLDNRECSVIHVQNTVKALQNLSQIWTKKINTKVVAITGSNGKTTTRSFAQTLFSHSSAFASPKSYNNHIGVPLSLLSVNRKEAFLIQEIGTNSQGEIAFLTSLCNPVISTVTMIGPSHLDGLSSVELVAKEKQQIYFKSPKALWLFNRDNPWTEKIFQKFGISHQPVLTFSSDKKKENISFCFLKEKAQSSTIEGHIDSVKSRAKVSFSGNHNLENLMCACGLALGAGIDPQEIWSLIPKCKLPKGRQEWIKIKDKNISILFDAYNANPSSMNFFLNSCKSFSKANQRLFVLGDMKELGKDSIQYHKHLAEHPALLNSRFIAFVGDYGSMVKEQLKQKDFRGRFVSSKTYNRRIFSELKKELKPNDFLALKASRSLKLEDLLFDLTGKKVFDNDKKP